MTSTADADVARSGRRPDVPAHLSSPTAKLVYVYLSQVGEATVSQLTDALGVSLLSLLPTLRSLERQGFVARTGERCRFVAGA